MEGGPKQGGAAQFGVLISGAMAEGVDGVCDENNAGNGVWSRGYRDRGHANACDGVICSPSALRPAGQAPGDDMRSCRETADSVAARVHELRRVLCAYGAEPSSICDEPTSEEEYVSGLITAAERADEEGVSAEESACKRPRALLAEEEAFWEGSSERCVSGGRPKGVSVDAHDGETPGKLRFAYRFEGTLSGGRVESPRRRRVRGPLFTFNSFEESSASDGESPDATPRRSVMLCARGADGDDAPRPARRAAACRPLARLRDAVPTMASWSDDEALGDFLSSAMDHAVGAICTFGGGIESCGGAVDCGGGDAHCASTDVQRPRERPYGGPAGVRRSPPHMPSSPPPPLYADVLSP